VQQTLALTRYLVLALGALLLLLSVAGFVLRARFIAGAKRCSATVSRVGLAGSRHYEIVRFRGSDGVEREARVVGSGRTARPVGTPLEVLFNPDRPGRVLGNTWWDTWGPPIVGMGSGMGLVLFHLVRSGVF
jgi:hypothetical protein